MQNQSERADRPIHVDTEKSELLVNNRFAYVSVSRAQHDAHIYTNDGSKLSRSLSRESPQRTATEVEQELAAPKAESVSQRGGTALRRGARSSLGPIPGTSSVARLEENVRAADVRLTDSDFARIEQAVPKGAAAGARYDPIMLDLVDR